MIVSHGLEGNNKRPYISGMVRIFYENDWNVIAWNYRGCNGKTNKSIKSYHSGFTEDLVEVVQFALSKKIEKICLIGFSLGGNLTLKYLGDPALCHEKVRAAVAISAPVDLHKSCEKISKKSNIIYARRFLRTLKNKVRQKARLFPEINTKKLSKIHDLMSFDNHYTAPIHGFKDAMDYYRSCSSLAVLKDIKVPTLIINALNDPFLPDECYPAQILKDHPWVFLEMPKKGGHVGFRNKDNSRYYWSEQRAFEFINSIP